MRANYKIIYQSILKSGMFWEYFPEFSGVWDEDKKEWVKKYKLGVKLYNKKEE